MADFPALPLWTDAYLSDTRHLSTEQHGAYLLLLMEAWRRPTCSLPDDEETLARLAGLTPARWAAVRDVVMAFWVVDGRSKEWRQKRLANERKFVSNQRASQKGRIAKRWNKTKKPPTPSIPDAYRSDTPTPTPTYSDTNVSGAKEAPPDIRKALFIDGLASLRRQTGKSEAAARKLIGGWLKVARDDAGKVLTKIRQAEADQVADAIAWVTASLKSQSEQSFLWARG